jgi:hypothetical protein
VSPFTPMSPFTPREASPPRSAGRAPRVRSVLRTWHALTPGPALSALLRHRKELGTKNSVSDIETDVLTGVRLVARCGNVAGTMRHIVLIACRSGA